MESIHGIGEQAELLKVVRGVRTRWKLKHALRGLAYALAGTFGVYAVAALVVHSLNYSETSVMTGRAACVVAFIALIVQFVIRPLLPRIRDERTALYLEEHEPTVDGAIFTSIEVDNALKRGNDQISPALAERLKSNAIERARAIGDGRRVDAAGLRNSWLFVAVVIAQVVSTLTAAGLSLAVFRSYPAAPPAALGDDAPEIRRFAIQSSIASGLTSLRTSLPTVLVGIVASPVQTADFRAAQAPATAAASLSAPARLVLLAEQTRDIEQGRGDRALKLLGHYLSATAAIACVLTPVGWWAMPTLVRWVYGAKWLGAASAFRVMLLAAMVQLVFAWTKSFPVSIGRPGLRTAGQILEIAVLVPAVLVLAGLYGATGAAAGVLAGAVVLASFWSLRLVELRRELA